MKIEEQKRMIQEIEEETNPTENGSTPSANPKTKTVKTKVPEVEIHLYRQGKGPMDVFKSRLAGWDQDQLEVREILHKYGFKSIFAFSPESGRGVPIRFNPRNGRSMLVYKDGSVIHIDGEPMDSVIKPITKILFGVAVIALLISFVWKENPQWMEKLNIKGNFPPWVLACVVIVFTRMRKRTGDFLKKYGW
ncbi:uncharacterized protein LOC123228824 [Mangifera indica]|uniref:uncharacterized protein LOC123228824 n=1 Tax=Mangifera indica TaxID=29780 RepID=UPI001CFA3076|nr:uncharacterized protein LOC123228824 [Mangifera indica]